MANEKIVKARQRQKTDTSANWGKAGTFVPLKGEIIVYQDQGVAPKFKIGDGTSTVGDLKFVSGGLTLEDIDATLTKSGKAADAKVAGDGIKSLVSRVTTTEKNIETNSDNITILQNQVNTNSSDISSLKGQTNTNTNNISSLSGRVNTNSSNISSLQGQVNTHSSDISSLQSQVNAHSSDISTLKDQAQNYATKTYVQEEISKAELGGGGDIDVSNLATKQDLVDLIDDSLKESGKAADAKVVGERFDSLDTIVAIDENSDGNIVLRPYLGQESGSGEGKVDSEYGEARGLTVKEYLYLFNEETETGCNFLNNFDYENDEPYLEILGDDDEPVRLGNISAPVSELDVVNKQYADGNFLKKENGIARYLAVEGDIVIRPEEQEDGVYFQGNYVNGEYAVLNVFGTYTDEPVAICNIADPVTPRSAVPLVYANEHYAPKRVLIWENPDPAVPFESTDYTPDTLDFDGIEVIYILSAQDLDVGGYGADVRTTGFLPFIKGYEDESINVRLSNYGNTAYRYVIINKDYEEINFNDANGQSNAYLIPVYIYGINT